MGHAAPEPSPAAARLAEKLLAMVNDPEHKNRLAAQEAARTDPWRWYCRTCGAEGQNESRLVVQQEAFDHLKDSPCGSGTRLGEAQAGRLLHVWTY